MLRDLGGLAYEVHRTGGGDFTAHSGVIGGKIERLALLDSEAHAIEQALGAPRSETVVFEPGVGGTCDVCGELFASAAKYCSHCGTPSAPAAPAPTARAVPVDRRRPPRRPAAADEAAGPRRRRRTPARRPAEPRRRDDGRPDGARPSRRPRRSRTRPPPADRGARRLQRPRRGPQAARPLDRRSARDAGAARVSTVETPPPPEETAAEPRCPRCGAPMTPEQDWCLNCGAAVGTRVVAARGWRVPIAIGAALLAIAAIAVAIAIVTLADDTGEVAQEPPPTAANQVAPTPAPPRARRPARR